MEPDFTACILWYQTLLRCCVHYLQLRAIPHRAALLAQVLSRTHAALALNIQTSSNPHPSRGSGAQVLNMLTHQTRCWLAEQYAKEHQAHLDKNFEAHLQSEDMAAIFSDADADSSGGISRAGPCAGRTSARARRCTLSSNPHPTLIQTSSNPLLTLAAAPLRCRRGGWNRHCPRVRSGDCA